MSEFLFGAWAVGAMSSALLSLALLGLSVAEMNSHYSGSSRRRKEARAALKFLAATPLAPLWPLAAVVGLVVGFMRLWSTAELPTPRERAAAKRDRRAVERDRRVREQAKRIEQLEREAGIR